MSEPTEPGREHDAEELARQAAEPTPGLLRETVEFLLHNKKWWLLPIFVALLLVATLIVLGTTPAGPFLYTFF